MPNRRQRRDRPHRISAAAIAAFQAEDFTALHLALGLKPWEQSPLDVDDGPPPAWSYPGHAVFDTWSQAQELRRLLEAAG